MSREIVLGTAHRYNWVQIGAAINHPDAGKILDLSDSINKEMNLTDSYVKIYPSSGYGNMDFVRQVMDVEKPDAIFIFTDPRYWVWLFNNEREIRSKIPIVYLNIWDDLPYPMWNRVFYRSCDALFAISKQTYNINRVVLGDEAEEKIIRYIPHGINSKYYYPVKPEDPQLSEFRTRIFGEDIPEFTLLYNARNLGRKLPGNIILAWRHFCDKIGKEAARKCCLMMHTDPVDNSGTDLPAVYKALCDPSYVKVKFVPDKFDLKTMNLMYNLADGVILVSSNEGWGLSATEALMTGKMLIGTVTGGIQDQMRFTDENGKWIEFSKKFPSNHNGTFKEHGTWVIPVYPSNRTLAGSPMTPYIYDDRVSIEDTTDAILKLYNMSKEEREENGLKGREWAMSEEAGFTAEMMSNRVIEGMDATFENFKKHPRNRYELIKVTERPSTYVDFDPVEY